MGLILNHLLGEWHEKVASCNIVGQADQKSRTKNPYKIKTHCWRDVHEWLNWYMHFKVCCFTGVSGPFYGGRSVCEINLIKQHSKKTWDFSTVASWLHTDCCQCFINKASLYISEGNEKETVHLHKSTTIDLFVQLDVLKMHVYITLEPQHLNNMII